MFWFALSTPSAHSQLLCSPWCGPSAQGWPVARLWCARDALGYSWIQGQFTARLIQDEVPAERRISHCSPTSSAVATELRVSEDYSRGDADGDGETHAIRMRDDVNRYDRGAAKDCQPVLASRGRRGL